jgi:tripartite ATP-independent transporter DctM subunit
VELLFLLILILLMVTALAVGFPVAFALPGSAILTIALAALCGYLFAGDVSAYFAQDGPIQWLSAGVTNFRSLYWLVERDTLIAIPLFIFMGIMLQRSKIAEDLLVAMAQLFGPIPGGLGISVVLVGALLAATTGIVGATVVAMGLISLPAMLRNNYSHSLATGTICASGTLGQIIPPSIVLIILADQLSNAVSQASTIRKAEYTAATGEFSMPSDLDVVSASTGEIFMGALIPGLILVGMYVVYILIYALINPKAAPPVPYEGHCDKKYDGKFAIRMFVALTPPLVLIISVLGSILSGIATVNQAGAIGSIGAMLMASYRLTAGKKGSYWPILLAVIALAGIVLVSCINPVNIKNVKTTGDFIATVVITLCVIGLFVSIFWSLIRIYKIQDTLTQVMAETAKMTSMVFIILIGAAMLTSAFRAFGGEELIKHFLTELPGGFWTQFIVVMLVIFLLGFFLDFIEIVVVVVPLVAPILLSNPEANITAVWFGVMVGLNLQTSFLTPPFGFALFYLRGVAPPTVKTMSIYKGVSAFILLQLLGLVITGCIPPLANYLPNRIQLTSENAPPPINPWLQYCIE